MVLAKQTCCSQLVGLWRQTEELLSPFQDQISVIHSLKSAHFHQTKAHCVQEPEYCFRRSAHLHNKSFYSAWARLFLLWCLLNTNTHHLQSTTFLRLKRNVADEWTEAPPAPTSQTKKKSSVFLWKMSRKCFTDRQCCRWTQRSYETKTQNRRRFGPDAAMNRHREVRQEEQNPETKLKGEGSFCLNRNQLDWAKLTSG